MTVPSGIEVGLSSRKSQTRRKRYQSEFERNPLGLVTNSHTATVKRAEHEKLQFTLSLTETFPSLGMSAKKLNERAAAGIYGVFGLTLKRAPFPYTFARSRAVSVIQTAAPRKSPSEEEVCFEDFYDRRTPLTRASGPLRPPLSHKTKEKLLSRKWIQVVSGPTFYRAFSQVCIERRGRDELLARRPVRAS